MAISTATTPATVFVGALTINTEDATKSGSGVFRRSLSFDSAASAASAASSTGDNAWIAVGNVGGAGPTDLDGDAMPKDRMALLPHPTEASTLFVAGNGDTIAYRVNWQSGSWTDMTGADTADNSAPHCDCRNFHWSADSKELYLVSDGGIFGRTGAESAKGGVWRSMNGDIGVMEFLTAHWDAGLDRWVGGAQDNDVQAGAPHSKKGSVAQGFVFGDGTVTKIDNTQTPARLFGARQFLGSKADDDRRQRRQRRQRQRRRRNSERNHNSLDEGGEDEEDDDDDIPPGLQFLQGYPGTLVPIPLDDFGFAPENFPYFAHPYELNTQVPTEFTFWALAAHGQKGGFWVVDLPPNITRKEQIQPARYLRSSYGGSVLTFVAGGVRTSCMRHSDES